MSLPYYLTVNLPQGALDVSVNEDSSGNCVVISKENEASPLCVGDILRTLNGVKLAEMEGKTSAWAKVFQESSTSTRRVLVQRTIPQEGGIAVVSGKNRKVPPACSKSTKSDSSAKATAKPKPAKKTSATKKSCKKTKVTKILPKLKAASVNVAVKAKGNATKKELKAPNKKTKKVDYLSLEHVPLEELPSPGFVCPNQAYYTCENDDTYVTVAGKLGLDDWKNLSKVKFNVERYGIVSASQRFMTNSVLRIPIHLCSQWKVKKLVDAEKAELESMATCSKCLKKEQENDTLPMLMCDGCDLEIHLSCAGLDNVPEGDWLCQNCMDVLKARKRHANAVPRGERSLEATLPPLKDLDSETKKLAIKARHRLEEVTAERKCTGLQQMKQNQLVLKTALESRILKLELDVLKLNHDIIYASVVWNSDFERIKGDHDILKWGAGCSWVRYVDSDGEIRTAHRPVYWGTTSALWDRASEKLESCLQELRLAREPLARVENEFKDAENDYKQAKEEEKNRPRLDDEERKMFLSEFATIEGAGILDFETIKQCTVRLGEIPIFLGVIQVEEPDVQILNMLVEPTELIMVVPTQPFGESQDITVGKEYYLFGKADLFCSDRDDFLPMDFSHTTSIRKAQRHLISMLLRDPRNESLQTSRTVVPASVELRGSSQEHLSAISKCFDLSELVRDCNYPIQNKPIAPTPKRLGDKGLVLRDYQQASLQWMIDKENDQTGLGFGGELWSRMRSLDDKSEFFYCELTGSIIKNIFDFRSDVDQADVSKHCGKFPTGGILGEEMGLGKTVIALSLVVANPPPMHNRILPREYISQIEHPAYSPPPSILGCTSSHAKKVFLSNASLVIAPMTLCSQWQSEIERFAPWMSTITLHSGENPTLEEIASTDIVIASTFLLQKSPALLSKLRRIHFHRIFVDEAHYNQTGEKIKLSLSSLSASHRYCLTGTPIGHSLADLYGQLRFLRIPQFCRPGFWKQNIGTPYSERNYDALQVLRSLLSHVVVRHSKEQTLENGKALVSLPSRTVETLLLPFASEVERKVYQDIEDRNTKRFMDLRSDSPKTVLGQYIELNTMMFAARQACGHASLVNLDKMQNLIESIKRKERIRTTGYAFEHGETMDRKKNCNTRAGIIEEAISKARESAKGRMRQAVLQFQEGEIELMECPVCLEPTGEQNIALTPCAHKFCEECILNVLQSASSSREAKGSCPECRDVIKRSELTFLGDAKEAGEKIAPEEVEDRKPAAPNETSAEVNGFKLLTKDILSAATGAECQRVSFEPLNASDKRAQKAFCHELSSEFLQAWNQASGFLGTKTSRLLEEIKMMIQEDPTSKCVVFSQFLGTLDLAAQELTARGVRYERIDGSMKQYQRADAILNFTSDPNTRVLLLSMRAGAAGLNLMVANHCFLMDAAMNSAVEEQAIDRIHRIGQTRPVVVKRFIIKDTIEERILTSRRALAADRPGASTQLDGAGIMAEEEKLFDRPTKRARHEDEDAMESQSFQRLERLEALFGCSATVRVVKA